MGIYYLWNEQIRIDKNRSGENYWFSYITEILSRLGAGGEAILAEEAEAASFGPDDVLFTGADALPPQLLPVLRAGLAKGMTLIGFKTEDAGELFGVNISKQAIDQPDGGFGFNGYFKIRESAGAILPVLETAPDMPVFSPVCIAEAAGAEIIADISAGGQTLPALFKYSNAYYFAFDLTQTMWVSAQGKPVYNSERGLDFTRISDARITPLDYDTTVAYGDYYLYILQSIWFGLKQPMIHRLPPDENGGVPDLMLYYAGDEDATPHISLRASEIMHGRGLPYHINLMPAGGDLRFVTTLDEYGAIKARGHELALHYNMVGCDFCEENFKAQYHAYLQNYGEVTVSTVGHCLAHRGWAERGRYLERLGIIGDSCRCGEYAENINEFNLYGFAFGTSYPIFLYDDQSHDNRKLNFADLPIAYYEPRIGGGYAGGKEKIHKCIDDAAYFGRMINLFTHPHYVSDNFGYDNTITLAALDEVLNYIKEKSLNVIHSAPDKVCRFWHGRDKSKIKNYMRQKGGVICRVECNCEDGLIIRFPAGKAEKSALVSVDGNPVRAIYKNSDGLRWLMVPVAGLGGHIINISE